jgi:isopentenyl-diphosphate delta-isomerase
MNPDDELLDLVDQNDNKIGTIWRSQKSNKLNVGREFLRASEILILNKNGELWIPRRNLNKSIAPGGLDYSASGHVAADESYEQGALRELEEELNLKPHPKHLKILHKFAPMGAETMFFRTVYIYKTDGEPEYNPDDFSGFEWIAPEELLTRLKNGEPAKRSLQETIEWLIEHRTSTPPHDKPNS